MSAPAVLCTREPSDAAWKKFGEIGARILVSLAQRDAQAEAQAQTQAA